MSSAQSPVPETPRVRVISPSPALSEGGSTKDEYSAPTTRSAARRQRMRDATEDMDQPASKRSRVRSRSPTFSKPSRRTSRSKSKTNGHAASNGYLKPNGIVPDISRSPSPMGLIPLHARYRNFIHRHEIPRKLLHVSIGFFTLHLYSRGIQTFQITPWLFSALVPIATVDVIRHRSETVNKFYIKCNGALMRESEVTGYNGVIWYLLGAYGVLKFFPKDVGVMGVLLLSWCDTAASTFGRLYGRHTFQLRKGKSFAGTLSAWLVGAVTAAAFWGYFVPHMGSFPNDPEGSFMFTGRLNLIPTCVKNLIGWTADAAVVTGPAALGIMSMVSGFIAAGSEYIDLFGWDDNFTIPVLSGAGLWGFLKVFG